MADLDIFINCPFDDEYAPLFEATVFTIHASLYRARCSLEDNDSSDIRLDRLCRLIEECPRSVHDLSRTQLNPKGMPRFNMPLELGMFLGAKKFGPKELHKKTALILIERDYQLPSYLSDLGGNDPKAHKGEVEAVIDYVRDYLHKGPSGVPLPGVKKYVDGLAAYKKKLPIFLKNANFEKADVKPFKNYRNFAYILTEFLRNEPVVP